MIRRTAHRTAGRTAGRLSFRGFSLIELAIAMTILVSVSSVAYVVMQRGGENTAEVGSTYATNYTDQIDTATKAGTRFPAWTCPADNGQVFTITEGDGVTAEDTGTYIFRCTGVGDATAETSYALQNPATGDIAASGGPWQKSL